MLTEFIFPRSDLSTRLHFISGLSTIDVSPDFVIVDSAVMNLYGDKLPRCRNTVELPGGEESKTAEILTRLWQEMSIAELTRNSRVLVIGGGSICDIGAFAASTWMRGVDLTLLPTTLLCMVDASLGGKTAVNIRGEKNQAGTVYPASNILICPEFLESLPGIEMINGLAEALKTSVIGDRRIVEYLLNKDYSQAVQACLAVKGRIVTEDLEETGKRRLLNLGHTIGHCIEAESKFSIGHGAAVAMGIPVAAEMFGHHDFSSEFKEVACKLGIETKIPSAITLQNLLKHLKSDKKSTGNGRIWIVPRTWEDCEQILLDPLSERELLGKAWRQ